MSTRLFRYGILLVLGTFFLLPLYAMLEFSTRGGLEGGRDLSAWRAIGDDPLLLEAIVTSLQLAVLTSVLMLVLLLPTMVWVHLRVPALRRVVAAAAMGAHPVPALSASLAWADTMAQGRGTTDLIQGQRDFFGRHGFVRMDTGAAHQHGPWADTPVQKVVEAMDEKQGA